MQQRRMENGINKPVARHFNSIKHSISDGKVCAIFLFSQPWTDKSSGFSPYSLYCFCSSTSYALINFKPPPRLLINFKNSKGLYLAFYRAFVIVFRMWLAYFPSHDYFSYMFTLLFIHFAYSRDNSQAIFRYTVYSSFVYTGGTSWNHANFGTVLNSSFV